MRRQQYYTDPSRKEFVLWNDFSGGMNSSSTVDNMRPNELSLSINMDFDERGSMSRRTGRTEFKEPFIDPLGTNPQLYHRHFITQATYQEIIAVDGKIYVDGVLKDTTANTDRIMEAVQWHNKTYIATGDKLRVWDGTSLALVEPFKPDPLSALYIGTNAIADDPNSYLADGDGPTLQITGVIFSSRYGTMNEEFTMTAYRLAPPGSTVEYKFEYRYPFEEDGVYHLGKDWSTSKVFSFVGEGEGDMQFRVSGRIQGGGSLAVSQYLVPKYSIKPAVDPSDLEPDLSGIHTCNRIILHWERLVMYGDTTNTNTIYISHLKSPTYFPIPNTLQFETTRSEAVNTIVRYRDYLVAFTDTSIQSLTGKSPSEYKRIVLNTSVGCVAPQGACVMDNYIAFYSADGIYYLKSVGYVDDKANVAKLDLNIDNIVPKQAKDMTLLMYDGQLHATFPSSKERFRFYKSLGIWTKDESIMLDDRYSIVYDSKLYHLRPDGSLHVENPDIHTDLGHVYVSKFETGYSDLGLPYHPKKLKELQIMAKTPVTGQVANVKVYIDGLQKTNEPIDWEAKLVPSSEYDTFIDKIRTSGKCMKLKVSVTHEMADYIQFMGFAITHKTKKP